MNKLVVIGQEGCCVGGVSVLKIPRLRCATLGMTIPLRSARHDMAVLSFDQKVPQQLRDGHSK